MAAFHAEVLPVVYAEVGGRLSELGRVFRPDIAIHFGLAQSCTGFRLERTARNSFFPRHADNAGIVPSQGAICEGPETLPSSLPLDAIQAALAGAGLPVEWSDDAGGYLCNTVFTLSVAGTVEAFRPTMSGFVHVPLIGGTPAEAACLGEAELLAGADLIIRTCVAAYRRSK